jgi:hypothetical protein
MGAPHKRTHDANAVPVFLDEPSTASHVAATRLDGVGLDGRVPRIRRAHEVRRESKGFSLTDCFA